jgi:hypothetical protein
MKPWRPTKPEIERIVECQTAGMDMTGVALFLGCTAEELKGWRLRCIAAVRAEYEQAMAPEPTPVAKPGVWK